MNYSNTIFCFMHGAGFSYFLLMGLVMMASGRGISSEESARKTLRRHTCIALFAWSLTYLNGLIVFALDMQNKQLASNINLLFDLALCAPPTLQMIHTITHSGKPNYTYTCVNFILGITFAIGYSVTHNANILAVASTYWILTSFYFIHEFTKQSRLYTHYIRNEYSNLAHRDIRWLYRTTWFIFAYGITYATAQFYQIEALNIFASILIAAAWTYIAYYIDRQIVIPNISKDFLLYMQKEDVAEKTEKKEEKESQEPETQDTEPTPAAENTKTEDSEEETLISMMLRKKCEEGLLYLQSDLTINALAQAIGTNRTYLWKHFKQKGTSFHSYVNSLRFEYAKKLLTDLDSPNISQVGKDSGFGSDASFRRIFGEMSGCSPSQFAAQIHKKALN